MKLCWHCKAIPLTGQQRMYCSSECAYKAKRANDRNQQAEAEERSAQDMHRPMWAAIHERAQI